MRRVKYQDFKKQVQKDSVNVLKMINRRAPRRRPRDPGEAEALVRHAWVAWEKAVSSGKLQKKGDRRYSLNIDGK